MSQLSPLLALDIRSASQALHNGETTALELLEACLQSVSAHNNCYNAFITIDEEQARMQARQADQRIQRGEAGPLTGIPLAIKDVFCTKGMRTTAGSKILENFIAPYESTVTARLRDAAVVAVGKVNMDEFAMGSDNTNSAYGPSINPWRSLLDPTKDLVPGGSSGGSAAAVAGYQCLGALGSDTGGSVRQPAAMCGLVGMKPSYGRCSRWGMVAYASSLDQAGVLTKSVADAALLLDAISGHDELDATTLQAPPTRCFQALGQGVGVKGLRIGIPIEYELPGMDQDTVKLWQEGQKWLEDAGAEIVHINLPNTANGVAVYYIIAPAEASSNLARYDGVRYGLRVSRPEQSVYDMIAETRTAGFGAEVKRRIIMGTYVLSAGSYDLYYAQAQRVRRLIVDDFSAAFTKVDAILAPTSPTPAYPIGEKKADPTAAYLSDAFTIPTSLAGLPAISVPCGFSKQEGLPLGLQVIAGFCREDMVFRVAEVLEEQAGFKRDRLQEQLLGS